MPLIKALASGSSGNCYIIQAGEEKLVIECGIEYGKVLKGLGCSIKGVVGCLISHQHLDHCKSFKRAAENFPKIIAPISVLEKYNFVDNYKAVKAEHQDIIKVGGFTVVPFRCEHTNTDGTPCENLGYLIQHPLIGKILFATDTYYLRNIFKDVDHILIECNYSEQTICALEPHEQRVFKSHMSLENLKAALLTWNLRATKTITLIHLSRNNGDPVKFKNEIERLTGIPTYVAVEGTEIS